MKVQDSQFTWVGAPEGGNGDVRSKMLIECRDEIDVIGGVADEDLSYEYDEFALIKLDGLYYLLETSGGSYPSPDETWTVRLGPATPKEIAEFIRRGDYEGYTMPKKMEAEFLALIEAEASR